MKGKKDRSPTQTVSYSFQKILTSSDLSSRRLALMEVKSPNPGPVVWLTGCVHGDEVGGMVVIQEIFRRLKKSPLIKGSLHAFPLMNPIGFEAAARHIVLSKEDLNRSFPGDPKGSLAERMADRIFSTIIQSGPAVVFDLHNDWIKSIPYVLIDPAAGASGSEVHDRVKFFAEKTDFLVIKESEVTSNVEEMKKTITGSLVRRGVPALTMELGKRMQ